MATSFDYVPAWATSTGRHIWNTIIDNQGRKVSFTAGEKHIGDFKLKREPGKVVRFTYSKQKNTVAYRLPPEKIPDSYMRSSNYIDITDDYWKCRDIFCNLFPSEQKYAYITVFNGMQWRPVYFGAVKNNTTVFKKMACGAIYLPMYYENDKLKNASYPILLDKEGKINYLKINRNNKINITIPEKEHYLIYRANKTYKLYYWDGKWILCGNKQIQSKRELTFSNIPSNTLYILVPEYSKGKERPFTVHSDGTLFYW